MKGGEVGAERLIQLAAREIEQEILPAVSGAARYRLRLVLNALKIAGRELGRGDAVDAAKKAQLAASLSESSSVEAGEEDLAAGEKALRDAIRGGGHDGDSTLYRSLLRIAEERSRLVR